jgi:hypothetical protein
MTSTDSGCCSIFITLVPYKESRWIQMFWWWEPAQPG